MTLLRLKNLPRDSRDTLFLLAVITWVALPLVGQVPLWCSLMGGAVVLWRGALAWRSLPLPSTVWRLGLLALAVAATLLSYRTLLGREAGVTLLLVLLALKTLELRARRDAFVVFFLSFFLMLTQFFYSQSLLTAATMLLALWGLLTALVNAHMPVGKPPLWQAARIAGQMTLLGAPIMVVLFMLFPRLAPLWGLPSDAMTGRSGLSATMAIGNIANLALDDSVAMRVRFDGKAPETADMYYRGPVLSQFDGQRWSANPWTDQAVKPTASQIVVQGDPVNYQVTLEPNQQPWLLTLDATAQAPQVVGQTPRMTPELQWVLRRPVTELLRYQVQSFTRYQAGLDLPRADQLAHLALPPGFNPRTVAWAQELRLTHPDPTTRVNAVMAHLRTGEGTVQFEPRNRQCVKREHVVVHQRVVEGRERAVVAEVRAGHRGVSGKPTGVVVEALPCAVQRGGPRLAARGESARELALGNLRHRGWKIDQHPVEEVDPWQVGRHFPVGLVDIVAAAGHVEVVADQRQRAGARRQVAPSQVRIDVVRKTHALAGQAAGGVALRDGFAIGPAVAPESHRVLLACGAGSGSRTPDDGLVLSRCAPQHLHHRPQTLAWCHAFAGRQRFAFGNGFAFGLFTPRFVRRNGSLDRGDGGGHVMGFDDSARCRLASDSAQERVTIGTQHDQVAGGLALELVKHGQSRQCGRLARTTRPGCRCRGSRAIVAQRPTRLSAVRRERGSPRMRSSKLIASSAGAYR